MLCVCRAEHAQHCVELAERRSSDALDLLEGLPRELGTLVEDVPAHPCLHDHDVHRVAQRVVQLPSEPSPLLQHHSLLQGLSLPLLRVVQLAAGARAVSEQPGDDRRDPDRHEDPDVERSTVGNRVRGNRHRVKRGDCDPTAGTRRVRETAVRTR